MEKLPVILLLLLAGCGDANLNGANAPSAAPSSSPGGVFFDSSVYDYTEQAFSKVRVCLEEKTGARFEQGSVHDLSLVIMFGSFDCTEAVTGKPARCNGQFTPPNTIKVSKELIALKHEMAHYLLHANTGDSDPTHSQKEIFTSCV